MEILSYFLDMIHIVLVFIPVLIYFIPIKYIKHIFKYLFLILILIPVHWDLCNNKCIFTIISHKLGGYKDMDPNAESLFSAKYLRWLYEPFMKLYGVEWSDKNVSKMVIIHWIINFILLWYYLFFVGGKNLI